MRKKADDSSNDSGRDADDGCDHFHLYVSHHTDTCQFICHCVFFGRLCSQHTLQFERRHVFLTLFLNIDILCPDPCLPVCLFCLLQVPLGMWKAALGLCKAGMCLWKAIHFGRLPLYGRVPLLMYCLLCRCTQRSKDPFIHTEWTHCSFFFVTYWWVSGGQVALQTSILWIKAPTLL